MRCFNHPDIPAIGVCKSCSKGICRDCATDLNHGLACKNKHETEVESLFLLINRSEKTYHAAPQNIVILPIFFLLSGMLFSISQWIRYGSLTDAGFLLGLLFIIFGCVIWIRNYAIIKAQKRH